MNPPNAFDDLARRKLNEREHPFDEAAWNALQPELIELRGKRRKRRFILWLTLLIGVGAAGWWVTREEATTPEGRIVSVEPKLKAADKDEPKKTTVQHDVKPAVTAAGANEAEGPSAPIHAMAGGQGAGRTPSAGGSMAPNGMASSSTSVVTSAPILQTGKDVHELHSPDTPHDVSITPDPAPVTPVIALVQDDPSTSAQQDPPFMDTLLVEDAHRPVNQATADTAANTVAAWDTMVTAGASTSDTTSLSSSTDTAYTTTAPTPILPALPQRKLELYAWGGPFMTNTRYSGDHTTDWASTATARRSYAYGIELMRQGGRFGFGAGLHYTTYAEDIRSTALTDEQRAWVTSYHINAIDTSILIVNGSVWINGQQYHVTQMRDTTINVLVRTENEVVTTYERRAALARSNRTNYLEVPLLFEAHLHCGNWSLAARGGPMLGILQGRRGQLPGASGYTSLEEEAFSELVLGYTVQGHVRYHFSKQWSIGVGPAIRGQLLNTMQGDAIHRRSTGTGGVLSIGYRLP